MYAYDLMEIDFMLHVKTCKLPKSYFHLDDRRAYILENYCKIIKNVI